MTLYQKILLFLIQAACYCNQGKVGHSFKDAIKLNDWDKRLKDVQNAEKTVFDLDLDIKAQQTALYQRTILTERRDEKDDACLARLRLSDLRLDKNGSRISKVGYYASRILGFLTVASSMLGRKMGDCYGSGAIPAKAKPCFCARRLMSSMEEKHISSVKQQTGLSIVALLRSGV